MILAIDTSIGTAVAIVDADGAVRAEAASADPRGHAEVIGDLLVRVLSQAGSPEITAVAAGTGPGPFTGLRVGIAAARAFALGRGIPVVSVASHDAAARAWLDGADADAGADAGDADAGAEAADAEAGARDGSGPVFAIVTDARRRELAVSLYRASGPRDSGPRNSDTAFELLEGPRLVERASSDPIAPFGVTAAELSETSAISAGALGRVAAERLASGTADTAASEPLYLRAPDVTMPGAPKRVGT